VWVGAIPSLARQSLAARTGDRGSPLIDPDLDSVG